ncbi:hypothetical protein P3W33_16865 [Luteibacter sp. PPL552]
MHTQSCRHWNLARLLSRLERLGHVTADDQAHALSHIVTPGKLMRMTLGGPIPSLFARALEHTVAKPKGWLDHRHPATDDVLDTPLPRCALIQLGLACSDMNVAALHGEFDEARCIARTIGIQARQAGCVAIARAAADVENHLGTFRRGPEPGYGQHMLTLSQLIARAVPEGFPRRDGGTPYGQRGIR